MATYLLQSLRDALWGGLVPIPRQLAVDISVLLWQVWILLTVHKQRTLHRVALVWCSLVLATGNLTNRWTLTLPLVPFSLSTMTIQWLTNSGANQKTIRPSRTKQWIRRLLILFSGASILSGALLSVLFPAVELPSIKGPYHVGAIDVYLPLESTDDSGESCDANNSTLLPVRIFFPTAQTPSLWDRIPYLTPEIAEPFCTHCMKYGAPPPLDRFGWILHTWRLITLPVVRGAPIVENAVLPLVLFSHGLGGSYDIYSYQAMALAATGHLVVSITHTDGSAPVSQQPSQHVPHNTSVLDLYLANQTKAYDAARTQQTERRVYELLSATRFLRSVVSSVDTSTASSSFLAKQLLPLLSKVDLDQTVFMGHSFGGSTVLTAAYRRPDWVKTLVVHEPATGWIPDDVRQSLFAPQRLRGLNYTDDFDLEKDNDNSETVAFSIHDKDMLVVNSQEWHDKNWGQSRLFQEMHTYNRLGNSNSRSRHHVIDQAKHNEFSDTCILTPLWLAREVGLTGPRNPLDTAAEIAQHTRGFLSEVLQT